MHSKLHDLPTRAFATATLVVLASLLIAACGGSSKTASTGPPTATVASSTTPTAATTPTATSTATTTTTAPTSTTKTVTPKPTTPATELAALRACLARNGIQLPNVGSNPLQLLRSVEHLPRGVTRSRYEAAVRICTRTALATPRTTVKPRRITNPRTVAALQRFAACMRQNKVDLPNPNTSGNGPVFDTKGLNLSSPQFRAALVKCSGQLREVLKAKPGAAQANPFG
jgi:hypothetical protein